MVTNEQYDAAYKNPEYVKIMNKASFCYSQSIPFDELHRCKLMALWEALRRYKKDRGKKFTSYLYDMVRYHCWKWMNNPQNKSTCSLDVEPIINDCTLRVQMQDAINNLPVELREIMYERYYQNKKLKEIAVSKKCSIETIRRRIDAGLKQLKQSFF